MLGSILNALHVLIHLILTTTLWITLLLFSQLYRRENWSRVPEKTGTVIHATHSFNKALAGNLHSPGLLFSFRGLSIGLTVQCSPWLRRSELRNGGFERRTWTTWPRLSWFPPFSEPVCLQTEGNPGCSLPHWGGNWSYSSMKYQKIGLATVL